MSDAAELDELRKRLRLAEATSAKHAAIEEALRDSKEKYEAIFGTIDEGFCLVEILLDDEGRPADILHLDANPAYERQTGLKNIVGKRALEIAPEAGPWLDLYGQVALTGKPARIEPYYVIGRWITAFATKVGGEGSLKVAIVFNDVTERVAAEEALRESEERQAFLLKLSDQLRPLSDPSAIQDIAARTLGQHLDADRAYYAVVEGDYEVAVVEREYLRNDAPSVIGTHLFSTFGSAFDAFRLGRTRAVDDLETADDIRNEDRPGFRALSIRSFVNIPLVKNGRSVAGMTVLKSEAHRWTPQEISLVEEVAERTWAAVERARAEAALRQSEERFAQFAASSSDGLWIRDTTLAMEFASPAMGAIYGVPLDALLGDTKRWAALIVPEDRETALAHLERARQGEAVVHEFRIQRISNGVFRWIRSTDFPLLKDGDVHRIGGIDQDVTETKLLAEHQSILLAELQHRVRNIMTIIRSMALRTSDGAADVEEYQSLLEGRLLALARVQVLLTRAANAGGWLRDTIESEVGVQASYCGQFELDGPAVRLSPKAVEVLTLAFHELATNAVKYGAFSTPNGRLRVSWSTFTKRDRSWVTLDWTETGAPLRSPVTRRGFGSDLIEGRIPYELGGSGKVVIGPTGAQCRLEFPLKDCESILETDAPTPAVVFGGTLDMKDAPDLTGRRVLVVEDDYYMAGDTAAALRGAGATVLGPCPTEEAARDLLESETPTHAVLDLNLGGGGPRFEIANLLKARGVPFVFLTGYDPDVIPADLADVVRMQKPVPFRNIVEAVGQL